MREQKPQRAGEHVCRGFCLEQLTPLTVAIVRLGSN